MCPIYVQRESVPDERGLVLWSICRKRSGPSGLCDRHAADLIAGRLSPVTKWEPAEELWLA